MALDRDELTEFITRMADRPAEDIEKLFLHIVKLAIANRNDEAMGKVWKLRKKNMKVATQKAIRSEYAMINAQQETLSKLYHFLAKESTSSYSRT